MSHCHKTIKKGKGIGYTKFQAVIILDGMKEDPIRPRYKAIFKILAIRFFAEYYLHAYLFFVYKEKITHTCDIYNL